MKTLYRVTRKQETLVAADDEFQAAEYAKGAFKSGEAFKGATIPDLIELRVFREDS